MSSISLIRNCTLVFKCPQIWSDLDETSNEGIRYCSECDRGVYIAQDEETLALLAALGKCVAYDDSEEDDDTESLLLGFFISNDVEESEYDEDPLD